MARQPLSPQRTRLGSTPRGLGPSSHTPSTLTTRLLCCSPAQDRFSTLPDTCPLLFLHSVSRLHSSFTFRKVFLAAKQGQHSLCALCSLCPSPCHVGLSLLAGVSPGEGGDVCDSPPGSAAQQMGVIRSRQPLTTSHHRFEAR